VSMSMELAVRLSRDPFIAPCICANKKPLYTNSVRVARAIARASHPSPCFFSPSSLFPRVRPPSPPSSDARCIRYKIILHEKGREGRAYRARNNTTLLLSVLFVSPRIVVGKQRAPRLIRVSYRHERAREKERGRSETADGRSRVFRNYASLVRAIMRALIARILFVIAA